MCRRRAPFARCWRVSWLRTGPDLCWMRRRRQLNGVASHSLSRFHRKTVPGSAAVQRARYYNTQALATAICRAACSSKLPETADATKTAQLRAVIGSDESCTFQCQFDDRRKRAIEDRIASVIVKSAMSTVTGACAAAVSVLGAKRLRIRKPVTAMTKSRPSR